MFIGRRLTRPYTVQRSRRRTTRASGGKYDRVAFSRSTLPVLVAVGVSLKLWITSSPMARKALLHSGPRVTGKD